MYDGSWGADQTFLTSADTLAAGFSFIAGGDSRTNMADWQTISNRMSGISADFHLFAGDLVNSGTTTTDWDAWYAGGTPFLQKHLIYYGLGNHEAGGAIYYNQFVMPAPESYYSFSFGNSLFIVLNSEDAGNAAQLSWLRSVLQAARMKWTFIMFHRPFFTVGTHSGEMDAYFPTWWKLFDSLGVDVILNGHTHQYMRSVPINRDVSTSAGVAEYGSGPGQGRLEVVAGSYGAPLYACAPAWYAQTCVSVVHYTKWVVSGDTVRMIAVDVNGNRIDSLTLIKPSAVVASARSAPAEPKFSARPNPVSGNSAVTLWGNPGKPWEAAIFSLDGKILYRGIGKPGSVLRWNPGLLSCGVYLARFRTDGRESSQKIILMR